MLYRNVGLLGAQLNSRHGSLHGMGSRVSSRQQHSWQPTRHGLTPSISQPEPQLATSICMDASPPLKCTRLCSQHTPAWMFLNVLKCPSAAWMPCHLVPVPLNQHRCLSPRTCVIMNASDTGLSTGTCSSALNVPLRGRTLTCPHAPPACLFASHPLPVPA
eukprot:1159338-Pelagomonas_calceolata.AAC.3